MVEDDKKTEIKDEKSKIVERDNLVSKFVKAGLIVSSTFLLKNKSSNQIVKKVLENDYAKLGIAFMGTSMLSNDENYGGNLLASSSFVFGVSGVKTLKNISSTVEGYKKIHEVFSKMDDVTKKISLSTATIGEKTLEVFSEKMKNRVLKNINETSNEPTGKIKEIYNQAKLILGSTFDTVLSPLENIKKHGIKEGLKKNYENISDVASYRAYKELSEEEKEIVKHIGMVSKNFTEQTIFEDEVGMIPSWLNKNIGKSFGASNLFGKQDLKSEEQIKLYKKINKYKQIEGNTTFTDMMGMYTKFDSTTNQVKLNISKISSSEANNLDMLQNLYSKFEIELKQNYIKNKRIGDFDYLESEVKEGLFVNWLNKNGFEDFVKNNYDVDNALKVGDINEMFAGKTITRPKHLEELEKILTFQKNQKTITEDIYNQRMARIQETKKNYASDEILDYLSNNFNHSNLKRNIEVSDDGLSIKQIKNFEILKNFTFSNVVTKSKEFGFVDKTALDGDIMMLKGMGILEKNFVGFFKTPFTRPLNRWNPFKLIESENRIKNIVGNEYNPYGLTSNGYFNNGKIIQFSQYTKPIKSENGKQIILNNKPMNEIILDFFTDGEKHYRRTFLKSHIDTIDEDYEVLKENIKKHNTYTKIWETYKNDGIKKAIEVASKSEFNPLPIRYDAKGTRLVNPEEAYFNEVPIWQGVFNKNLTQSKIMEKAENTDSKIIKKFSSLIFGKGGEINARHLKIDNAHIEARKENAMDFLIEQIITNNERRIQTGMYQEDVLKEIYKNGYENATPEEMATEFIKYRKMAIFNKSDTIVNYTTQKKLNALIGSTDDEEIKNYLKSISKAVENSMKKGNAKLLTKDEFDNLVKTASVNGENFKTFFEKNKSTVEEIGNIWEFSFASHHGLRTSDYLKNHKTNTIFDTRLVFDDIKDFYNISNDYVDNKKEFVKEVDSLIRTVVKQEENLKQFKEGSNTYEIADYVLQDRLPFRLRKGEQLSDALTNIKNLFVDLENVKNHSETGLIKELTKNQVSGFTDISLKTKEFIKNRHFTDNETEDLYNMVIGYGYNHTLNKTSNKRGMELLEDLSDFYSKNGVKNKAELSLASTRKSYAKSDLGEIKDTLLNKETTRKFISFEHFEKVREKVEENVDKKNNEFKIDYFKAIEIYKEKTKVLRKESYGPSIIIEDTLKRIFSAKTVMEKVSAYIQEMANGFKKNWYFSRTKDTLTNKKELNSYKESKNFGQIESTFGLFMKKAINQVQGPLEYIGVERITNKALGNHWTEQYKNFMKYRYLPLMGITAGYIALDSATDTIVPDEMPIIGNGITGVATRTYATGRIGLQYGLKYTGLLSVMEKINDEMPIIDNGLTWFLDPLMDPEEMIDVYFKGKAVRVNKNRNWYTAGRQTGEGEEFDSYRPHLLYTLGNPSAGIYDNKLEKFFRQDFLLTKYPWTILDPYMEERQAYDKYGAIYPMTEQLFKDVPLFGGALNATIGEIIKPSQYIAEELWKVGDDMMINPGYDERNPFSSKYIKYKEPNKILASFFDFVEDYKTFSGMHGYLFGKTTEMFFGSTNPYNNEVVLDSLDKDIGMMARYNRLQLGGMFGTTEGIRRLLNGDNLGTIAINPLEQNIEEWLPEYYKKGRNPYLKNDFGEFTAPGNDFNKTINSTGNEELDKLKILSFHAPFSKEYKNLQNQLFNQFDNFTSEEKNSFLESISYADNYGEREFSSGKTKASSVKQISLKIDEKISPTEFLSNGKRYVIDNVEQNFNKITEDIGSTKATNLMSKLNNQFQEGKEYIFKMSEDSNISVGIDEEGDYIKIASDDIDKNLKGDSAYNRKSSLLGYVLAPFSFPLDKILSNPMPSHIEKIFGKKTAYNEWAQETVEAPYFRDWDSPISSFVEPFYNYSSNHLISAFAFNNYSNDVFMNSTANINSLGTINKIGMGKLLVNSLTGNVTRSSTYNNESKVHYELEKIKAIAGDKSYFNMTGNENLKQFQNMTNENDSKFLEGLANTTSQKEREKIISTADEITGNVLKTIWNRHDKLINPENNVEKFAIEKPQFNQVIDIEAYAGDVDKARAELKTALSVEHSKLDNKRTGIIKAYRGGGGNSEASFLKNRIYRNYNKKSFVTSTIYPSGTINFNEQRG